jgi:hypothetical protein
MKTFDAIYLKEKFNLIKIGEKPINTRIHRAISWLKCAEEIDDNMDLKFISLWIAFNSCYAMEENSISLNEQQRFKIFINKLVTHDVDDRFYNLMWLKFPANIRLLIENKYVFKPFWDYNRGDKVDWHKLLQISIVNAHQYLSNQKVDLLLEIVLDRLYTVRNQLIHGGATFKSKVNRAQVNDGANMLSLLVPLIIDIMLENIDEDWGTVYYPVV